MILVSEVTLTVKKMHISTNNVKSFKFDFRKFATSKNKCVTGYKEFINCPVFLHMIRRPSDTWLAYNKYLIFGYYLNII